MLVRYKYYSCTGYTSYTGYLNSIGIYKIPSKYKKGVPLVYPVQLYRDLIKMMTNILQNLEKNINLRTKTMKIHQKKHQLWFDEFNKNRRNKRKMEEKETKIEAKIEANKPSKKLEVGDKYLNIKLVGHEYIVAFKNKDKITPNQPDYKGDGVAIWITEKKAPPAL